MQSVKWSVAWNKRTKWLVETQGSGVSNLSRPLSASLSADQTQFYIESVRCTNRGPHGKRLEESGEFHGPFAAMVRGCTRLGTVPNVGMRRVREEEERHRVSEEEAAGGAAREVPCGFARECERYRCWDAYCNENKAAKRGKRWARWGDGEMGR